MYKILLGSLQKIYSVTDDHKVCKHANVRSCNDLSKLLPTLSDYAMIRLCLCLRPLHLMLGLKWLPLTVCHLVLTFNLYPFLN